MPYGICIYHIYTCVYNPIQSSRRHTAIRHKSNDEGISPVILRRIATGFRPLLELRMLVSTSCRWISKRRLSRYKIDDN